MCFCKNVSENWRNIECYAHVNAFQIYFMHKVKILLHSRKIKALIFPQWGSHRRLET